MRVFNVNLNTQQIEIRTYNKMTSTRDVSRINPTPLEKKDSCKELDEVWFNDTALKIILFLMKNNNAYYTREEIATNSYIKISTLERYLPKLANSEYNLIIERLTGGNKTRANHVKEYHINPANPIIKSLEKLIKEIAIYRHNVFKKKIG